MLVITLDAGNYRKRGVEYVHNLRRACSKFITLPFEFVVFSERDVYGEGVRRIATSPETGGFYQKLFMLGGGALPKGERCLFLDLDTLILANIDDMVAYRGGFLGLGGPRDYRSFGSAILAWEAGTVDHIWTNWLAANKPQPGSGDDEWINGQMPHALRAQRFFPGVKSYKFHKLRHGPTPDTRLVFFQRDPKPDNCGGWAQHYWSTLEDVSCTPAS